MARTSADRIVFLDTIIRRRPLPAHIDTYLQGRGRPVQGTLHDATETATRCHTRKAARESVERDGHYGPEQGWRCRCRDCEAVHR